MLQDIKTYRHLVTLKDGAPVRLRAFTQEDKDALIQFFAPVSREDTKFMRSDVTDPTVVTGWVEHLDYSNVLPIIALLNNQIVGDVTLHFKGRGPQRHVAELRVFLSKCVNAASAPRSGMLPLTSRVNSGCSSSWSKSSPTR